MDLQAFFEAWTPLLVATAYVATVVWRTWDNI